MRIVPDVRKGASPPAIRRPPTRMPIATLAMCGMSTPHLEWTAERAHIDALFKDERDFDPSGVAPDRND
jgi:hypothetical protein